MDAAQAYQELQILLQALAAIVLGGVLGWERESAGKWAGLRTHILVSLASLLLIRLGQLLVQETPPDQLDRIQADPSRIIEAIIAGIAFLGAGTIIRDRADGKAKGLTTAASLLLTATIGISVALDHYIVAVGTTLLGFLILRALNLLEARIAPDDTSKPSD